MLANKKVEQRARGLKWYYEDEVSLEVPRDADCSCKGCGLKLEDPHASDSGLKVMEACFAPGGKLADTELAHKRAHGQKELGHPLPNGSTTLVRVKEQGKEGRGVPVEDILMADGPGPPGAANCPKPLPLSIGFVWRFCMGLQCG